MADTTQTGAAGTTQGAGTAGGTTQGNAGGAASESKPEVKVATGETTKAAGAEGGAKDTATKAAPVENLLADEPPAAKDGDKTAAEELTIKLPEGVEVDAALLEEFKPLAKELGLKSEGAQKLVDLVVKSQQGVADKFAKQWQEQNQKWVEQAKNDKEMGGAKFEGTRTLAAKAMSKFATPELRQFLKETGLGNHPEMVRLMARAGKALSEDSVAGSTAGGTAALKDVPLHEQLYPSMSENKE